MKLIPVLALSVALGGLQGTAGASQHRAQECRYRGGGGYSDSDVKQTIRCAVHRWGVPGGYAKARCIAKRESGFNEREVYTDHLGVYQHVRHYWPARFRAHRVKGWHLHPSALNARSNVVVSIRMAHAGGWGAWSTAGSC